jgi:hypothetical protein
MGRGLAAVHRWLGVALSFNCFVWFLSGIGMMFWDFPSVSSRDHLPYRSYLVDAGVAGGGAYAQPSRRARCHGRLMRFDLLRGDAVMRRWISALCVPAIAGVMTVALGVPAVRVAAQARGGRGATGTGMRTDVDLQHVMRGILFPASNVVFAAQEDLSVWKPAADPSTSPNPLTSTYGGWMAVENASLALVESANLLLIPGRQCSSGKTAPVQRADWIKFVQGLRDAGMSAYKAAQSKNQDAIVAAAGDVADACSACHAVYREKPGEGNRCVP